MVARRSRQPKQTITNQTGKLTQKDSLNIEIAKKIPSQGSRYVDYLQEGLANTEIDTNQATPFD